MMKQRDSRSKNSLKFLIALAAGLVFIFEPAWSDQQEDSESNSDSLTIADSSVSYPVLGPNDRFVDTSIQIKKLDFDGVLIREAVTALARAYNVSCYIDAGVTGTLTMRLENVSLDDAFRLIVTENNLSAQRIGST
ncbi:MAG: hypothetical protein IIB00_07095, partial [candidate division Zixibacteria bacterium]|nr:hypothetical protein [candidate division Zixibacteria bacterium]